MELDVSLRVRVHCMMEAIQAAGEAGIIETSPGECI